MARIKPKALLMQSKMKKSPSRISFSAIITCNLVTIFVVLSLYATYRHWYHRPSSEVRMDLPQDEHLEISGESAKTSRPSYAILDTAKGSITMEIYKDASSDVVDRFVDLWRHFCSLAQQFGNKYYMSGHFKATPFHHVIKNYVIQGGDFDGNEDTQDWILKGKTSGQLSVSPKHEAFMIGTTKNLNSKGFDLVITTAPIPNLNDKLVVFGRVIKGEDIVQEIEEVDTDEHYRPKTPVGIINITLKQEL